MNAECRSCLTDSVGKSVKIGCPILSVSLQQQDTVPLPSISCQWCAGHNVLAVSEPPL